MALNTIIQTTNLDKCMVNTFKQFTHIKNNIQCSRLYKYNNAMNVDIHYSINDLFICLLNCGLLYFITQLFASL
jgi:hypothetical protein